MTHPVPQYGTPRRPDRPTDGARIPLLARSLGVTPHPWQQHALDVAGELVPHHLTGELVHAYRTVSISVGRRAGKSLAVFLLAMSLIVSARRRRLAWFTAQDRVSASLTMRNEWLPLLDTSPLTDYTKTILANGQESLSVPRQANWLRLFAPTPTALHGQYGDLIVIDEAWSFSLERGRELETAFRPLRATRPGSQIILLSAAGDADSTWWIDTIERGREAAAEDSGFGHCHIEYTVDGTELDPDSPVTWRDVHPGQLDPEVLREEYEHDRDLFVRSYLNVTDRVGVTGAPFDPGLWAAAATDAEPNRQLPIALGLDVSENQEAAAIVACYPDSTIEVLDHKPGTGWVTDRLTYLCDNYDVTSVAYDVRSPAGVLQRYIDAAGIYTLEMSLADGANAAAGMVNAARTGNLHHVPDLTLTTAVNGARRRSVGDGAWSFSRRTSPVDVSPLIAASYAWFTHPDTAGGYDPTIY